MEPYKEPPPPYSPQILTGVHRFYGYYQPPATGTITEQSFGASAPNHGLPSYGSTQHTSNSSTIIVPEAEIIIIDACPACRVGVLEHDFTYLGLLCAILFFPVGILCCLLLKEKKCSNCGALFG